MKFELMLYAVIGLAVLAISSAYSHGDDDGASGIGTRPDIPPVTFQPYAEECGSCHMAYPPGLLPARSWERLLSGLEDHFGENAEMDATLQNRLQAYLVDNAAERSPGWIARRVTDSVPADQTPLRISTLGYMVRKHDEIPPRLIEQNPEVGGLGQCTACHGRAEQGLFDEHAVRIPGFGRWDD